MIRIHPLTVAQQAHCREERMERVMCCSRHAIVTATGHLPADFVQEMPEVP